jgi:hypothetical protein
VLVPGVVFATNKSFVGVIVYLNIVKILSFCLVVRLQSRRQGLVIQPECAVIRESSYCASNIVEGTTIASTGQKASYENVVSYNVSSRPYGNVDLSLRLHTQYVNNDSAPK